jgi:hypothetical protein
VLHVHYLDKGGSFLVPPTSIRRRIERTISSPSFEGHRVWPLHVPFRASLRIDSEELFPELAVCSKGITPLSYHLIVLRSIVWILPQEDGEDCVIAENITIVRFCYSSSIWTGLSISISLCMSPYRPEHIIILFRSVVYALYTLPNFLGLARYCL